MSATTEAGQGLEVSQCMSLPSRQGDAFLEALFPGGGGKLLSSFLPQGPGDPGPCLGCLSILIIEDHGQ